MNKAPPGALSSIQTQFFIHLQGEIAAPGYLDCVYRLLGVNGNLCGKAEVGREPGNGKLPLETFRLVGANITKH
jgi:hypothetical protein